MAKGNVMKSFVRNVFWNPGEQNTEESTPVQSAPVQPATTSATPITIPKGEEDKTIKEMLAQALQKANKDGYDYIEFATAIEAQASVIPDEGTRYRASLAVVSAMGITPVRLIDDANYYVDALKREEANFKAYIDSRTQEEVTSKENILQQYSDQIAEKAEQIKKLTEEINSLQQEKQKVFGEIAENRMKIDVIQNNFKVTFSSFVSKITDDIDKIKRYLMPSTPETK